MRLTIELTVTWNGRPAGKLWHSGGVFHFVYTPRPVDASIRSSMLGLVFPELVELVEYKSPRLFPVFSQRVPLPSRPDFRSIMDSWGVCECEYSDPLAILAKSGGKLLTDHIELRVVERVP